jgi:hypothetical protein
VRAALRLVNSSPRETNPGGRPRVVDELAKGKIVALVAAGFSLRQVAGFLGISHSTVSAAIAADQELQQEIQCARQRSLLHPLACIVRESGRNWKAAVWLVKHIEELARLEQPLEERTREAAEADAAVWIRRDMADEIRDQAARARRRQRRLLRQARLRQQLNAAARRDRRRI